MDYTLRLLRKGYVNIWDEARRQWINYHVTESGNFFPLPEDGIPTPAMEAGDLKPCVNSASRQATVSLITLPVRPQGLPNGVFWFSWSE